MENTPGTAVIYSFDDKDAENLFRFGKMNHRLGWALVASVVKRKLDMIDYAKDLLDLRSPPNNRLEKLKGDREGFYSIRINDQWRIIFRWDSVPYDVSIVDYH